MLISLFLCFDRSLASHSPRCCTASSELPLVPPRRQPGSAGTGLVSAGRSKVLDVYGAGGSFTHGVSMQSFVGGRNIQPMFGQRVFVVLRLSTGRRFQPPRDVFCLSIRPERACCRYSVGGHPNTVSR